MSSWRRPALLLGLPVVALVAGGLAAGWVLFYSGSAQAATTVVSVLSDEVLVQEAGSDAPRAAVDGEVLGDGDTVITRDGGRAVITFFEGSTQVLEPDTAITIERMGSTEGGGLLASVNQAVGRTWNQVLDTSGSGSDVEVTGPAASAAVRDTMFQVTVEEDGTTGVWTKQGSVSVAAQGIQQTAAAGTRAETPPGAPPGPPEPEPPPLSELQVTLGSAAWLLLIDPRGLAVGCLPPGAPANQVSLTVISDCSAETQTLSLRTLVDGTYQVYLSGREPGSYDLSVIGRSSGSVVCRQSRAGRTAQDERWRATLDLDVRAGRLLSCGLSAFVRTEEDPPAKVVLPEALVRAIEQGQRLLEVVNVVAPTEQPTSQVLAAEATATPTAPSTSTPIPPTRTPRRRTSAPPPPPPAAGPVAVSRPPNTATPRPPTAVPPTRTFTPRPTPVPTRTPVPTPTPIPLGYLKGSVLEAGSNRPIGGATVEVLGAGLSATSEPGGFFIINNIRVGTWTVRASAFGYSTQSMVVQVAPGANPLLYFSLVREP